MRLVKALCCWAMTVAASTRTEPSLSSKARPQGGRQGRRITLGDDAERIEFLDLRPVDDDIQQGTDGVRALES